MDEGVRSVLLDPPEKTLVVEGIEEYASPQGIAEHGDDPSALLLECCNSLLCPCRGSMGVHKILLQKRNPDRIHCVLLLSGLESLFKIVGSRCKFFFVEFAPTLPWHCVQMESVLGCQDRRRAHEIGVHQMEDETIHSFPVSRSNSRCFRTACLGVELVSMTNGGRRFVALRREAMVATGLTAVRMYEKT